MALLAALSRRVGDPRPPPPPPPSRSDPGEPDSASAARGLGTIRTAARLQQRDRRSGRSRPGAGLRGAPICTSSNPRRWWAGPASLGGGVGVGKAGAAALAALRSTRRLASSSSLGIPSARPRCIDLTGLPRHPLPGGHSSGCRRRTSGPQTSLLCRRSPSRPSTFFFVISHDRRRIVHWNVTQHPKAPWVWRQILEATPWTARPRFLIRDRDRTYGEDFVAEAAAIGITTVLTPVRAPTANAISAGCCANTCRITTQRGHIGRSATNRPTDRGRDHAARTPNAS